MSASAAASGATLGPLLLPVADVELGAAALLRYLENPSEEAGASLLQLGIDDAAARDLARAAPRDAGGRRAACDAAAAWALGRRSVTTPPTWEPVVTSGNLTDQGIDRMTAETLIGLVVGARKSIRLFSAYVDQSGLDVLAVSLAAATRRGVRVALGCATKGDKTNAMGPFVERLREAGNAHGIRAARIGDRRPFPHLKLLAVDGMRAYLGSANLTWPALTSNVEFGALVRGEPVAALERCFDALLAPRPDGAAEGGVDSL